MIIDYSALGRRISQYRGNTGLSQEQLAFKLNMSRKHISQIEIGISYPALDTLLEIANVLGTTINDLLIDSLENPTAFAELQSVFVDCNKTEQQILLENMKHLKILLVSMGI